MKLAFNKCLPLFTTPYDKTLHAWTLVWLWQSSEMKTLSSANDLSLVTNKNVNNWLDPSIQYFISFFFFAFSKETSFETSRGRIYDWTFIFKWTTTLTYEQLKKYCTKHHPMVFKPLSPFWDQYLTKQSQVLSRYLKTNQKALHPESEKSSLEDISMISIVLAPSLFFSNCSIAEHRSLWSRGAFPKTIIGQ